ncbi:hypothetical protein [Nocardia higoensis]|uniref:hypothetical protein n=1 Tax=Nocardia higoensis TaxID=228599 RepID=UPI0005948147|nr:hypothetical protein [Nocardia higoensis]
MRTDSDLTGPWSDVLPAEAPVAHSNLNVTVGAREFTTLTRDHLHYWLGRLPHVRSGPFMTVSRSGQGGFIQTYRNSATDHSLEMHPPEEDGRYVYATVDDVEVVGELIWAWLENDQVRLDAVAWEHGTV